MAYDFQIAHKYWKKIMKKLGMDLAKEDITLCAHCALNLLELEMWEIRPFGYKYWNGKRIDNKRKVKEV